MNVFKDNKELNDLLNKFYVKTIKEDIDEIDEYLKNIDANISNDFELIYSVCKKKNTKISIKIIKTYIQDAIYKHMGVKKDSFNKTLEDIKVLQNEQSDYYTGFLETLEETKMTLIHTLKQYYKIAKNYGNDSDLREVYAVYQTIGLYIINMLPDYYKKDFDQNELFDELLKTDYKIENASNRYIVNIDHIIRDYILDKYDVDLFEYEYYKIKQKGLK